MQGYLFMFFSLFRQREGTKRDHVARFESEQITILKNCAAGLASLKQVLALPPSPFFNHRICVPAFDFVELAHARHSSCKHDSALAYSRLSRYCNFLTPPSPHAYGERLGEGASLAIATNYQLSIINFQLFKVFPDDR